MGKNRPKKSTPTAPEDHLHFSHASPCICTLDMPTAADGHNVEGWTKDDIRIYNELLTERAKLEKEKNELEQKSARHQAERALLNEDAVAFDGLFKAQLGGEYKFIGSSCCCLDFVIDQNTSTKSSASEELPCHHEICERSKSRGITWMEMDTIKYYQARISTEKSTRMKNALRKQRDVELGRVKRDDEEETALRIKKSASQQKSPRKGSSPAVKPDATGFSGASSLVSSPSTENAICEAAQENETVVQSIRARLNRIKQDVGSGKLSQLDIRAKLEQATRDMAEAERKNTTFRELVLAAGSGHDSMLPDSSISSRAPSKSVASSTTDAFSQALKVMRGFFSALDPRDVQAAITDLRSLLQVNGPMSPVLQKSFRDLEDMLAKSSATALPKIWDNRCSPEQTCTSLVEVLLMLRNGQDPKTLDALTKSLELDQTTLGENRECIKIEDGAKEEMLAVLEGFSCAKDTSLVRQKELLEQLRNIKDDAAMRSPIPALSDIVLEENMNELFYGFVCSNLSRFVQEGASERDVAGKITSMIIAFSDRHPERYLRTLSQLSLSVESVRRDLENMRVVKQALNIVEESMSKFVDRHKEKLAATPFNVASLTPGRKVGHQEESAAQSGGIVAEFLQKKSRTAQENSALVPPARPLHGTDARQAASTDISAVVNVVQDMQQQLKGLSADDVLNMLCTLQAGQSDLQNTTMLRDDLQTFLDLPTGLEDPQLLARIQQQIVHLASHDEQRDAKQVPLQPRPKTTRGSKFQEDLAVSRSPPPYIANEGRARTSAKVKQVPFITTQISDSPMRCSTSDCERLISAARELQAKTLGQKAQEMSSDLRKMRKDLLELTTLPGLSGKLAKKVRRQLDSLRHDMESMEIDAARDELEGDAASLQERTESDAKRNCAKTTPPCRDDVVDTIDKTSKRVDGHLNPTSRARSTAFNHAIGSLDFPAAPPNALLSDRELKIQRQLIRLVSCLDQLIYLPSSVGDHYGFRDTFKGIVGKLEEQMAGHVQMARNVSDVNGWKGLETWLDQTF